MSQMEVAASAARQRGGGGGGGGGRQAKATATTGGGRAHQQPQPQPLPLPLLLLLLTLSLLFIISPAAAFLPAVTAPSAVANGARRAVGGGATVVGMGGKWQKDTGVMQVRTWVGATTGRNEGGEWD